MNYNFTATGSINGPVLAAVFAVEAVVGFIANIIVLSITLYQRKSFKQPSTIFFTSLIISNLLDALVYLPMTTVATGAEEWLLGSTFEQRRATCMLSGIIFWFILYVSIGVLAAISFDKCLSIVKPHFYKRFIKPWVALIIIVTLWMIIALIFTMPLVGFGEYDLFIILNMDLVMLNFKKYMICIILFGINVILHHYNDSHVNLDILFHS